jgi:phosphoglycolate phosphatase
VSRDCFDLVVFDFDGTLCDSANVKTDAFYELYLDDQGPDFATAVRDYHLSNAGISRYDKIRYVERKLLGSDPNEERVEHVALRFSQLVEQAVVDAPLFDGVIEFLSTADSGIPLTIASATPTDELRRIADRKGVGGYFDAIEGSPQSKAAIITDYVSRFAVDPTHVVMVGDQPSDADGARGAGTDALLIAPPGAWVAPFARADDFGAAAAWLNSRTPCPS